MITKDDQKYLFDILSAKHYQTYHPKVTEILLGMDEYTEVGVFHAHTFDAERADFMFNNLDFDQLSVLDIGANIGYFSLCAAFAGASEVISIESDIMDSKLIELETKLLDFEDKINVQNSSFDFSVKQNKKYDVILCLNVLHHLGRYFDSEEISLEDAKKRMIEHLNLLSSSSKYCWFQMGFNWKGDENNPLFNNGLKNEVIDFISDNVVEHWEIQKIGILDNSTMQYQFKNPNMNRINELGEFGNRPLFLLKSKKIIKDI